MRGLVCKNAVEVAFFFKAFFYAPFQEGQKCENHGFTCTGARFSRFPRMPIWSKNGGKHAPKFVKSESQIIPEAKNKRKGVPFSLEILKAGQGGSQMELQEQIRVCELVIFELRERVGRG